jgi:hypothetical protein
MENFTKCACVIDTCSIINLDEIQLGREDVLSYIRRFFDVRVGEPLKDEFNRHRDQVSSREASYWSRFLSSRRYVPTTLTDDEPVIGPFYTSPPVFDGVRNAGEYANARVALELLLTRQIGHILFITDDQNAENAFLDRMQGAFPGIRLWTSADVIIYLGAVLLKESKLGFDDVKSALRDVYAATARVRPRSEITQGEKDSNIRKLAVSVDRLKLILKVTDHWRN